MTAASACPACAAGDLALEFGAPDEAHTRRVLSLPAIHCPACIRGVEATLAKLPGVSNARVNFSLKRVTVDAAEHLSDSDLMATLTAAGFEAHALNEEALESDFDARGRALLWRLGLAGFAMMNVMLLSVAVWSGAEAATRDLFHWISAMIALPVTVVAAQPFWTSAWGALKAGRMNMDVPIALALLLTVGMSLYETSQSGHHAYFDAALGLTFFLLIGRYLDHRVRRAARSAAKELTALEPAKVRIDTPDGPREVDISALAVGDVICLQAGGRAPVDGVLEQGQSMLDLSFITGEADPVPSSQGQTVAAGTIALTGPIRLRATAVGQDSTIRRLASLVEIAENARGAYRSLSDKAAAAYAPGVHILSALAFLGWFFATSDLRVSVNIAVAVLIITCPCALGLAVPAVATHVTARLFSRGVLLKSSTALERLGEVDTIVFDKTGTLTRTIFVPDGIPARDLPVLKALADASDHPLARAVSMAFPDIPAAPISDILETPGFGVTALTETGEPVALAAGDGPENAAHTVFQRGSADPVPLQFREDPLSGAADMITALTRAGYRTLLMSGDKSDRVQHLAGQLGIAEAHAGVTPHDKAALIAGFREAGARVLMVGDGLNDTAAMAGAHASIAPATALEASRNAADAVLLNGDIAKIPEILREADLARARMRQNFVLASLYNVIAVPVAAMGYVTPLVAAIAMSASSITVIVNAVRPGGAR